MATLRVPEVVPSPTQDSERLRQAVRGYGTDEEAIIWILGHRDASQRREIRDTYKQLYDKSLVDRLHSELFGDFRKAVLLWTYDPAERDARLANEALKTRKKRIKQLPVIVEIACASTPRHLQAVRQAYCFIFDCSLEEDIASSVSPPLRKLLVGLVKSYRYDKELVDIDVANSEAAKLREALKMKQLFHDDVVYILGTRNLYQLRATFKFYKHKYGIPIEQEVRGCGNGQMESMLIKVISCIDSPEKHFAEVIRASIIGLGTDEDSLTRAIVTRAEIDLIKIREEYSNMFQSSLDDAVIGNTSGDYRHFLTTLLGGKTEKETPRGKTEKQNGQACMLDRPVFVSREIFSGEI